MFIESSFLVHFHVLVRVVLVALRHSGRWIGWSLMFVLFLDILRCDSTVDTSRCRENVHMNGKVRKSQDERMSVGGLDIPCLLNQTNDFTVVRNLSPWSSPKWIVGVCRRSEDRPT
ncbi:hypothetical protein R3P38DRAFT_2834203 [Favolaschia claudopus]|uniref:Secreted protein n=1 Tax=Favolaschia claudopus TaxID=2862362 RepID=A0AAW0EAT5_9AGAR